MKKTLILTALMAVTAFSAQASTGTIIRTGLAGAGTFATAAFIMVNDNLNKLMSEFLSTAPTKAVVTPLIRTAAEKSHFLRKLATGLVICAAASFVINKALENYETYTLNKAVKKCLKKTGPRCQVDTKALTELIKRK